jgi:serine/threonine protein kinase
LGISLCRILTGKRPYLASSSCSRKFIGDIKLKFKKDIFALEQINGIPSKIKHLIASMINPFDANSRPSASDIILQLNT